MSHVALLVLFAAAASSAASASSASSASSAPTSNATISDALEEVMASARDAVVVAVAPIDVDASNAGDVAHARLCEKELVRVLLDRGREQVVSPAYLRTHPSEPSASSAAGPSRPTSAHAADHAAAHAADHVVVGKIEREEGGPVLHLRLLLSETGEVLATSSTRLMPVSPDAAASAGVASGAASGASARGVRGVRAAVDELVAEIAWAIEESGATLRTHRTAVMPVAADDDARIARIDRLLQSELTRALVKRGLLVVERAALDDAVAQQGDEAEGAPRLGQLLGAQSLVVGNVAATGATFTVDVRVLSTSTGQVIGASRSSLPREGVVAMADVEMRTPLEAAVRSAVAPGWGQSYNRRDDKALMFALAGYSSVVTTAGLGVGGALLHARYADPAAFEDLPPASRAQAATDAKALADGLYISAAVAGAVAASVWSLGIVDAILDAPGSSTPSSSTPSSSTPSSSTPSRTSDGRGAE